MTIVLAHNSEGHNTEILKQNNTFYESENTNQRPRNKYLSINIFHTQYTSLNQPIAGHILNIPT
jgi:hypothetical protein